MKDRELEALVAERVLGWHWVRFHDLEYESPDGPLARYLVPPANEWLEPPDYVVCDLSDPRQAALDTRLGYVPRYFTDPAADYAVLQHVRGAWDEERRRLFRHRLSMVWKRRVAPGPVYVGEVLHDLYEPGDYSLATLSTLGLWEIPAYERRR